MKNPIVIWATLCLICLGLGAYFTNYTTNQTAASIAYIGAGVFVVLQLITYYLNWKKG